MSVDIIANMLSSVKNASMAGRFQLEVPYSRANENIAKILKEYGYFSGVKVFKEKGKTAKKISIEIANEDGVSKITDIRRVSKPGLRVYKGSKDIGKVSKRLFLLVMSTNRGLMSGTEAAKRKLGGEVVCLVW